MKGNNMSDIFGNNEKLDLTEEQIGDIVGGVHWRLATEYLQLYAPKTPVVLKIISSYRVGNLPEAIKAFARLYEIDPELHRKAKEYKPTR